MPPVAAGNSMLMVDALIADSESEADEPERFALTVARTVVGAVNADDLSGEPLTEKHVSPGFAPRGWRDAGVKFASVRGGFRADARVERGAGVGIAVGIGACDTEDADD